MATTTAHLFRSVRKEEFPDGVIVDDHAVEGVLYPAFEDKQYDVVVRGVADTRTRRADTKPVPYGGGMVVSPGKGTSLFDKDRAFGTKNWWYFKIPDGTIIPPSIQVRHTGYNDVYDAEHYQIEPAAGRMPVVAYKGALDNLARNAIKKLYDDAR
jgi:Tse2 ADP-ribosyltransferase toxins